MENLTVIIPFRDGHQTIERLLDSISESNSLGSDMPVVVVDDVSAIPFATERANVRVVRRETRGYFSGAVNTGIENCETDVLVLNQDVWLEGDAWQSPLRVFDECAIVGDGVFGHPAWTNGYVQGTFMLLRREAIQKVGLLNAKDYPLWGATCEWQLRACRAGFRAMPLKDVSALGVHHARQGNYGASIAATLNDEAAKRDWLIRTPPAISVIITCYNYGRYLTDAVNSLIGGPSVLGLREPQTFQSFEIALVDDGSADETREVGEALADAWKGIRFIRRNTRGGSAAAANTGIHAAFGKYVTVLDADDMMQPTRLETLYRAAEQNPHRVIYDDLQHFRRGALGDVLPLSDYNFEIVLYKNLMHKGIFFERAAFDAVGGYPEKMNEGREDWAINVALGAKGYCGVHVSEPLYLYRREGQNRSLTNGGPEWRQFFLQQLKELFPRLYAGERPMGCCGNKAASKTTRAGVRGFAANFAMSGGRAMANQSIGAKGMTLLEYLIPAAGPSTYFGPVTGATYLFGGRRVRGFVDTRDADGMLQMREGRHAAFRVVDTQTSDIRPPSEVVTMERADDIRQDEASDAGAGGVLTQFRVEQETHEMGKADEIEVVAETLAAEEDAPRAEKPKRTRKGKTNER